MARLADDQANARPGFRAERLGAIAASCLPAYKADPSKEERIGLGFRHSRDRDRRGADLVGIAVIATAVAIGAQAEE